MYNNSNRGIIIFLLLFLFFAPGYASARWLFWPGRNSSDTSDICMSYSINLMELFNVGFSFDGNFKLFGPLGFVLNPEMILQEVNIGTGMFWESTFVQLNAGLKIYPGGMVLRGFYISPQFCAVFVTTDLKGTDNDNTLGEGTSHGYGGAIFIGYDMVLKNHFFISIGAGYKYVHIPDMTINVNEIAHNSPSWSIHYPRFLTSIGYAF